MNLMTQVLVYVYIVPTVFCFISLQVLLRTELFKKVLKDHTGKNMSDVRGSAENKAFIPVLNIMLSILILIMMWKAFWAVMGRR